MSINDLKFGDNLKNSSKLDTSGDILIFFYLFYYDEKIERHLLIGPFNNESDCKQFSVRNKIKPYTSIRGASNEWIFAYYVSGRTFQFAEHKWFSSFDLEQIQAHCQKWMTDDYNSQIYTGIYNPELLQKADGIFFYSHGEVHITVCTAINPSMFNQRYELETRICEQ